MDQHAGEPAGPGDARNLPGFYVDSVTPHVQRQAADAALLRDRRLEVAVDTDGEVRARMVAPRTPVLAGTGPHGLFSWAARPDALRSTTHRDENLGMTTRPSTAIAIRATPHQPSARLGALHRMAAEGAILRDGRLEIAIDEHGGLCARVVSTFRG